MRTSRLAFALVLVVGLALALGGCSHELCGRNSDCAAGEVCTPVGQCAVPPADAGSDGASDGSSVTVIDNNVRERDKQIVDDAR
jgi:hypothetical protein